MVWREVGGWFGGRWEGGGREVGGWFGGGWEGGLEGGGRVFWREVGGWFGGGWEGGLEGGWHAGGRGMLEEAGGCVEAGGRARGVGWTQGIA